MIHLFNKLSHLVHNKIIKLTNTNSNISKNINSIAIKSFSNWHSTTILCIRKYDQVCMVSDGQVSMGNTIVKPSAKKIRRINNSGNHPILVGFAGTTADALTLLSRLENKLEEFPGQVPRACVELAKEWRTDKYTRNLDASCIVADKFMSLQLMGNGDLLESHDGVLGIGSGSPYALAAAKAMLDEELLDIREIRQLSAEDVAIRAMNIAADMCVYTNDVFVKDIIYISTEKLKTDY